MEIITGKKLKKLGFSDFKFLFERLTLPFNVVEFKQMLA